MAFYEDSNVLANYGYVHMHPSIARWKKLEKDARHFLVSLHALVHVGQGVNCIFICMCSSCNTHFIVVQIHSEIFCTMRRT